MAKAIPITPEDWQYAIRIKTSQDFFNYLSRPYVAKGVLPALKVHAVEFIAKP